MKIRRYISQFCQFFVRALVDLTSPLVLFVGLLLPVFMVAVFGDVDIADIPKPIIGIADSSSPVVEQIIDVLEQGDVYRLIQDSPENLEKRLQRLEIDPRETLNGYLVVEDNDVVIRVRQEAENVSTGLETVINQINGERALGSFTNPEALLSSSVKLVDSPASTFLDFTMPGLLGLTIISSCIYGAAISLEKLFSTHVIDRIYLAPTSTSMFFLGRFAARAVFSLLQAIILFGVAKFIFDYTAINGWISILNTLIVSIPASIMLVSIGYWIAGTFEDSSIINGLAQLVVFPQIILCGTFIPVTDFAEPIRTLAKSLPLYQINEAIREITINGYSVLDSQVYNYILIMLVWTVAFFVLTLKTFRMK